ncbi:MAG: DUF2935 domain-containing protein [Erysipelotrichales bacterium]|nr:DUF2935 domain-containing protein [Erysipelotrichales bacterium]
MINENIYVTQSLELNLFFARIMKEHAFLILCGFTANDKNYRKTAEKYNEIFENILLNALTLGNGIISSDVVSSGELISDFTLAIEEKTEKLLGLKINKECTQRAAQLKPGNNPNITPDFVKRVKQLNAHALKYLNEFISYKAQILQDMLVCSLFTLNYPILIEHMIREAKQYQLQLTDLENGHNINVCPKETEFFWDVIMTEHACMIEGLLDPAEKELIKTAHLFAERFKSLVKEAGDNFKGHTELLEFTEKNISTVIDFKDFKTAATKGINECNIRSIIIPLVSDHFLRELNHYLRILKRF